MKLLVFQQKAEIKRRMRHRILLAETGIQGDNK
jgi:hypothetical protein